MDVSFFVRFAVSLTWSHRELNWKPHEAVTFFKKLSRR
ncbi:MAG: hypothetical protein ACI814_003537 [Mariniblastus sp.]|jgi:hypothetical protein